jgi:hypothetical protein
MSGSGASAGLDMTSRPGPRRIGTAVRAIGTDATQTWHRSAVIVLGEGGGTTPRPWVGDAESAAASRGIDFGDRV